MAVNVRAGPDSNWFVWWEDENAPSSLAAERLFAALLEHRSIATAADSEGLNQAKLWEFTVTRDFHNGLGGVIAALEAAAEFGIEAVWNRAMELKQTAEAVTDAARYDGVFREKALLGGKEILAALTEEGRTLERAFVCRSENLPDRTKVASWFQRVGTAVRRMEQASMDVDGVMLVIEGEQRYFLSSPRAVVPSVLCTIDQIRRLLEDADDHWREMRNANDEADEAEGNRFNLWSCWL
ncbi:MAG TPA: hypothetical protein PLJ50_14475 [Candidatus Latescibacteria bacterium]|nr:hypothetical protein [Candidatus Latescibacterota bacterium]